jgi:hypothetical protein
MGRKHWGHAAVERTRGVFLDAAESKIPGIIYSDILVHHWRISYLVANNFRLVISENPGHFHHSVKAIVTYRSR